MSATRTIEAWAVVDEDGVICDPGGDTQLFLPRDYESSALARAMAVQAMNSCEFPGRVVKVMIVPADRMERLLAIERMYDEIGEDLAKGFGAEGREHFGSLQESQQAGGGE